MTLCRSTTPGYKTEHKGRDFGVVVLRAHVCDAAMSTGEDQQRAATRRQRCAEIGKGEAGRATLDGRHSTLGWKVMERMR